MESLDLFVGIMFLILILSGPIAIALTFIKTTKRWTIILKRIFICQFSAVGIGLGAMLLIIRIPVGTKLIALPAIVASAYALKREFKGK
jgi:hypothetical protein